MIQIPDPASKSFFGSMLENLWVPETFAKIVFILVTAPFWWPLAKVMYHEILPALNAAGDVASAPRPPGQDPFLNIPLASYRARRTETRGAAVRAGAHRHRR